MIELAKINNPKAAFSVMDSRRIGELKSKYDAIVCGFCIPYLSGVDSKKLISDSYNLLLEDGLIYLSFVEGDPIESGFQVGNSGDRIYFYFHKLATLKTQLIQNDFGEIVITKLDFKRSESHKEQHTIITAKKR